MVKQIVGQKNFTELVGMKRPLLSDTWIEDGKRYNAKIRDYLDKIIDGADEEILVAGYYFTDTRIGRKIIKRAKDDKVKAVVVLGEFGNREKIHKEFLKYNNYKKVPFELYEKNDRYKGTMHLKLFVTDANKKSAKAYVGSANFTMSGLKDNLELGIGIEGEDAMEIGKLFKDKLLNDRRIIRVE